MFQGVVAPPLKVWPPEIRISDFDAGSVLLEVSGHDGVHFDLKNARLLDERFQIKAGCNKTLAISTNVPIISEQTILLEIPFRARDTEFTHTIRLSLVDSFLVASPSSLIVSEQDGEWFGRFIVRSKFPEILKNVRLEIEGLDVSFDSPNGPANFSHRELRGAKLFRFELPAADAEQSDRFQIIVRSKMGDESFEKLIECLIP